jgi:hypothetical protein
MPSNDCGAMKALLRDISSGVAITLRESMIVSSMAFKRRNALHRNLVLVVAS